MARNFIPASDQYAENTTLSVPSKPFTVCFWFRVTSAVDCTLLSWTDFGSFNPSFAVVLTDSSKIAQFQAFSDVGGFVYVDTAGSAYTVGDWYFLAVSEISDSSRKIYIDGNVTTNTDSVATQTISNIDSFLLAATWSGIYFAGFTGDIAEISMYDKELSTAQLNSLNSGLSASLVEPGNLVHYWKMLGDDSPEPDEIDTDDLTLTNSPAQATHPPIIYTPSSAIKSPTLIMGL